MFKRPSFKKFMRITLLALFVGSSAFFYIYSSPDRLIEMIGVHNSYILIFVLAFFGGRFAFSAIPYHVALITLATGGLNPFLLGLASAFGVTLGDAVSYFVGYQGSSIITRSFDKPFRLIHTFGLKHPKFLPWIFFLYGAFSPISNDFIAVSTGLSRYPFWEVMIPLALGNAVFNMSLAYFATQGYAFLQGSIF
jgi:membrane protein YqaA with SNARE-associated domain